MNALWAFPAPYQGDFKTECVSPKEHKKAAKIIGGFFYVLFISITGRI